jgi:hypothetical protein
VHPFPVFVFDFSGLFEQHDREREGGRKRKKQEGWKGGKDRRKEGRTGWKEGGKVKEGHTRGGKEKRKEGEGKKRLENWRWVR